ncbi:MAG: biopolymer transporter ExbD [Lacisediminimonas sp.]|nr:biopolymer transporter ExbD [Lacisediminimonas sp.]
MSFGTMDGGEDNAPLAEINMVPLIDVMLVLLVIFLVTAPLLTHAVKVELPRASSAPNLSRADNIQLSINAAGLVFWNGQAVDAPALGARLAAVAATQPQAELHIRADRTTPYENVARVMSDAARAGVARIGFVTDPGLQ